jgi:hypothetical protein
MRLAVAMAPTHARADTDAILVVETVETQCGKLTSAYAGALAG